MPQEESPHVAVGQIKEGVTVPVVPLEEVFDARLEALRLEHEARLQALSQRLSQADALTASQAATLSQTVASSATALEQRVNASASAAAGAVEQTRTAFEKSIDKNAEAALTSTMAVRREVELREEFNRRESSLQSELNDKLQKAQLSAIAERVELARASHEAEHTRIREIDDRAQIVRAAKDADSNEWRHTVEGLIAGLVSNQVLEAKLDAVDQRIALSERTTLERGERAERATTEREAVAAQDMNRRVVDLEKSKNENVGGRASLLAAASLTLVVIGYAVTIVLFLILHR